MHTSSGLLADWRLRVAVLIVAGAAALPGCSISYYYTPGVYEIPQDRITPIERVGSLEVVANQDPDPDQKTSARRSAPGPKSRRQPQRQRFCPATTWIPSTWWRSSRLMTKHFGSDFECTRSSDPSGAGCSGMPAWRWEIAESLRPSPPWPRRSLKTPIRWYGDTPPGHSEPLAPSGLP